jgi:hypothetical protein
MKTLLSGALLAGLICSSAQADTLLCASKRNAEIYFTEGQVRITAEINSSTLLSNVNFSIKGGENTLNSLTEEAKGKVTAAYVRFELEGSLFCTYKIALPKNFMTQSNTRLYVDASCEEGYNYSVQLNCSVQ